MSTKGNDITEDSELYDRWVDMLTSAIETSEWSTVIDVLSEMKAYK